MDSSSQNIGCHITLGEIATYINGYAFKPSDYSSKEGSPIIRIQDLTGNSYETNKFSGSLPEKYLVNNGYILISWSASLGVYEWTKGPAWLNQHIFKVVFDKKPINKSFFIHQARHIIDNSGNLAHGATMRHLTKKVFDALPFYYPGSQEQQQIAAHLDELSTTIDLCKTANQKLENLVKSRFVEMFGDLLKNSKGQTLDDISELITVGIANAATHAYADEGTIMLRNLNIRENRLDDTDLISIRPEFAAKYKKKALKSGDILVTRTGYPGVACIVPEKYAGCQTFTTLIVRLDASSGASATFVSQYINSPLGKEYVNKMKAGSSQQNFGATSLKSMPIVVPPRALQQEFADFVSQVDKLRFATQQQIEKLETLKKSLMQEYFG